MIKLAMKDIVEQIDKYLRRLFPICRSITGNGNRETLRILQELIPLKVIEYPSGTPVYDWVIPEEWNIRDAWIKNSKGEKIIDFKKSNLHVVSYSEPVHRKIDYEELRNHLFFREDLPDAIPYRTSYYKRDWGYCLSFSDFKRWFSPHETYEIMIDSDLREGNLTVGELLIPGKSEKEYLISTYICHPSLANDNLSGPVMTAFLARELMKLDLNFSYRILFVPETIGAIAYCAHNQEIMKKILAGFVVTCVGGPGKFSYKQSFQAEHFLNQIIEECFRQAGKDFVVHPFDIHGSDERQFSSQGFRINVCSICRDKYYEYDYYHTSLDDLDYVTPSNIAETLNLYKFVFSRLDWNLVLQNLHPYCEVMLGKHDLYPKTGGALIPGKSGETDLDGILGLLFHADGKTPLWEISKRMNMEMADLYRLSRNLLEKGLFSWK